MGIHISIVDLSGKEHPDWDCGRYSGDREVFECLQRSGYDLRKDGIHPDYDWYYRPKDPEHFRSVMHKTIEGNPDRWDRMADILAKSQDNWLYFGG